MRAGSFHGANPDRGAWAAALLLGLALACGGSRSEPVRVVSPGLELRVAVEPAVPRVGENRLWVELRDAEGRPIEDAELGVKVHMHAMGSMPAMGGPARVQARGEGRYRADFELDMGGSWQVELSARTPAGSGVRAEASLLVGTRGLQLTPPGGPAGGPPAGSPGPTGAPEVSFAPERLQRVGVRTTPAARKPMERVVRAAGRVEFDETALVDVSLKVRGWVGDLRVAALGDPVERGAVLFRLYSPELYAAQQEYLQALRSQARARETGAPERADYLVHSARKRLRLWDVSAAELARLERGGEALEYLPIRSPASGYVTEKGVVEGGSVEPGQRLYRIAPLDRVWIEAEIYESEIPLVEVGQPAEVTLSHQPDRSWKGNVAYIHPQLVGATRTLRLRVVLPNPEHQLRPDMWVTVRLRAERGERLVVPQSAVLHAGDRSFVFVQIDAGRFRPREVRTGMRSGEDVEVVSGLEEGEPVVTSGTFLIASESRLREALDQW